MSDTRAMLEPVRRLEVETWTDELDEAVSRDPAVDPFCSRSPWQLAYHDAFAPERPLWLAHRGGDFVLLAEHHHARLGPYLEPLENMWGFGCPLIGPGAPDLLADALRQTPRATLLLGLPMSRRLLAPLSDKLSGHFAGRSLEPVTRYVANLDGGIEAWLARRTASFRRNLRAAERRVREAGIGFRVLVPREQPEIEALYRRVLDVESRSWKSAEGRGADTGSMRRFYEGLWPRLAERSQLRVLFAEREGELLGYLHGALVGERFRGLQFSYDDRFGSLGLGNVLQLEILRHLCDAGARDYDLGSHSEYKRRWGEEGLRTFGLLLQPV